MARKTSRARKTRMTPAEQHARFIEAAKNAERDESGEGFERAFKKIVKSMKGPQKPNR